jgi:glycosyltransferase involved in cell wall biosynthesis
VLRIALISREYPPQPHGGIGTQTFQKAQCLATFGHEVYVFSQSSGINRYECKEGLVKVIRIPNIDKRMPADTGFAKWLTYSSEIASEIQRLNSRYSLDILDFPEWGGEGYFYLLNSPKGNRVCTVIQIHGPMVMLAHTIGWPNIGSKFYRIATKMEGTSLRLADAIFSSSGCSAYWCSTNYGLKRDKIPVLHAGVDTTLFKPIRIAKDKRPTVIFVGRVAQNKGIGLLLEAACQVAEDYPDLKLQIVGEGNSVIIEELKERARVLGKTEMLDIIGYVNHQNLPVYYSRANFFAAPSLYEGGPGFVYLEAMACGLPVIACEGSGVTEVVESGKNGILVPPRNFDSLVKALYQFLSNPRKCFEMGANARRSVVLKYDSQKCVRQIEDFYLSTIRGEN